MRRFNWLGILALALAGVLMYALAQGVQRRTPPVRPPSTQPRTQPPPPQRPPPTPRTQPREQAAPRPTQPPRNRGPVPHAERGPYPHAPRSPSNQRVYPVPGIPQHGGPPVFVPHRHYPQPYFVFRPRYSIGFGLYVGYPFAYPLAWGYPGYIYDEGAIVALPPAPSIALYGGVSLDVVPDDATVVVDGVEVGVACDFSPTEQPLTLKPGRHHVELRAPGLIPLAFDVTVAAGQVVPFSGTLQPR